MQLGWPGAIGLGKNPPPWFIAANMAAMARGWCAGKPEKREEKKFSEQVREASKDLTELWDWNL